MSFILGIWELLGPVKDILMYVGGALAIVGGIYWKGKSDARQDAKVAATEKAFRDARQRDAIEDDLRTRTNDGVDRMLDPWYRD